LPRAMSEDHTTVAEMQPQTSICADGDEAAPEGSSATQEAAEEAAAEPEVEADADSPPVSLKVIFNKRKIDLTLPVSAKVISLKRQLQELTGVPVDMQKLMFRGLCHDDRRLSELGVGDGAKLMLVGSTPDSLASVRRQDAAGEAADVRSKANNPGNSDGAGAVRLSQRDLHRRVLDKYGRPDDLTPGILNANLPLPPAPLSGMYNRQGAKVRLTFKLEIDQLWIGTKERTNKIPMSSIKRIVSEPIEGQEAHHIVGLQLGTTEQSMYWLYWVPCHSPSSCEVEIGAQLYRWPPYSSLAMMRLRRLRPPARCTAPCSPWCCATAPVDSPGATAAPSPGGLAPARPSPARPPPCQRRTAAAWTKPSPRRAGCAPTAWTAAGWHSAAPSWRPAPPTGCCRGYRGGACWPPPASCRRSPPGSPRSTSSPRPAWPTCSAWCAASAAGSSSASAAPACTRPPATPSAAGAAAASCLTPTCG
ncbi:hypothetical protein BOX15_Mlig023456g5, partial [Macrostomum lignano]